MKFVNRSVAAALASAAAAAIMATACSTQQNPAPAPTVTVTETVTAPAAAPQPTTDTAQTVQQALSYLQNPSRAAQFESVVSKAGPIIAKALMSGLFGKVDKYDEYKTPLQPGYVGWGGIMATNRTAFAWVYWNNGSIEYQKGITGISITDVTGDPASNVTIYAPDPATMPYWSEGLALSKNLTETADTTAIQDPQVNNPDSGFMSAPTLDELKQLDTNALNRLQVNMRSRFGNTWKA